ncbi:hypothetical protein RHSIM_Rhsim13G0121100 [Rhododendron simsii]|uniref:Uncharacterized protein n=1 Tax=Rhododendron simsii TaxID=118357 RepID=A0A834G6V2_RHOSS|nr:hypothetical protein RHSIM_Rhsim13G0121100 [Rhododendron simsii]
MSTATSDLVRRFCNCGCGPCIVKISGSSRNPGHLYCLQQNELVGKFHERTLEHEELMFSVFNTVTATGCFAQTPGLQGKCQMELDRDFPDEEEGHTVGGSGVGEVGNQGIHPLGKINTLQYSRAMPIFPISGSSGKNRKTTPSSETDISDVDNPRKLDVFMDFPNDYTRMKFIQSEHVAAMIMAQAKPNPYDIPPPLDPFPSDFY